MSDSSRVQVYQMAEVTFATIAATALKELRVTGESLKAAQNFTRSNELRADRQTTDWIKTMVEAQGGVNFELSYATLDDLIEGIMCSAWGSLLTVTAVDISASSVDNSINSVAAGFPAFVPGQWIKIAGFTGTAANNGYAQVVTRTASKIVITGITLVTDAAGESVTVSGTMIRNGTTKKSYTMEKKFTDITRFVSYIGMMVNTFNLNLRANEIVTGDVQFMGKSGTHAGATVGTGAAVAANTNDVMSTTSNVAQLLDNGVALAGTYARELSFAVNNKLRGKPGIGVLGNTDIGLGRFEMTGKLVAYFETAALYDKYMNNTASSLATRLTDAAGNTYVISVPLLEFTDGNVIAGGNDQDVLVDLSFGAKRHTTYDCMFQIDRFVA